MSFGYLLFFNVVCVIIVLSNLSNLIFNDVSLKIGKHNPESTVKSH